MSPKVMHIFCRGFLIILQLCRKIYLLWKSPYKKGKNFSVFYNDFLFGSAGRLNCYDLGIDLPPFSCISETSMVE